VSDPAYRHFRLLDALPWVVVTLAILLAIGLYGRGCFL
jgi:hypothetical protein